MITNEATIRKLCAENSKIMLIKEYRCLTGAGLKDSKDAIEKVAPYGSFLPSLADEMVALFNGEDIAKIHYEMEQKKIRQAQEAEQKAKEEAAKRKVEDREMFIRGVTLHFDHFKDLGYDTRSSAIQNFIDRIYNKGILD